MNGILRYPQRQTKSHQFHSFLKSVVFSSPFIATRNLEGNLCNTQYLAAMAEAICTQGNIDDYANSGCHKNAVKVLSGKDPTEVLKEAVKNGTGKAKAIVCGVPGFPDALKAACN